MKKKQRGGHFSIPITNHSKPLLGSGMKKKIKGDGLWDDIKSGASKAYNWAYEHKPIKKLNEFRKSAGLGSLANEFITKIPLASELLDLGEVIGFGKKKKIKKVKGITNPFGSTISNNPQGGQLLLGMGTKNIRKKRRI